MEASMNTADSTSRRDFLKGSIGAAVVLVRLSPGWETPFLGPGKDCPEAATPIRPDQRQQRAFELRRDAAKAYLQESPPRHVSNGDEERYGDRRASFAKTLPHNQFGEVNPDAYKAWLAIPGDPKGFEQAPRTKDATVKLNNPQATYAFDLVGVDPAATRLPLLPKFASAQMAIDMAEVYWQALTVDVPFRDYESHPLVTAAITDLSSFSQPLGSAAAQKVSPATLFRGETAGALAGPYISQFLWLEVPYGIKKIDQRYEFPSRGQGFLTGYDDWLACQQGMAPKAKLRFDAAPRFICSNRERAEYVHRGFFS
jgi:hypothetical protein